MVALSSPLSPVEERFVICVEALAAPRRTGGEAFELAAAPRGSTSHPARAALLGAWARSTSDDEREDLAREAELHALEHVTGQALTPRNADKRVPSEQYLVWWRLFMMYGRHPYVGPGGERVPWTPESDARALTAHYVAEAKKWLGSNKVESAKQPGYLVRWSDVMQSLVDNPRSYEAAPPSTALPPDGPLVPILKGERVLTGAAAVQLFDAATRLQIHFDVLRGAPSWTAVWTDIATSTAADAVIRTVEGIASVPGRAAAAAKRGIVPIVIGGVAVVGLLATIFLLRGRSSSETRVEVAR